MPEGTSPAQDLRSGPGRALVAVYAIFALAAVSRAGVQLALQYSEAPVAYLLSALAAVIYVLATVALWSSRRRVALAAIGIELVGVLAVGTFSMLDESMFPEATVWSGYGQGYGYVPLVLPILGLLWLRRSARS
jgi:cytochrome bd-type quinol oxidase subunit 2